MSVETYEVPEVDCEGNVESDEEALALIEKMGLAGQQNLNAKRENGEIVRCPYRTMTREERFVYGQICPSKTKLTDYASGPVPLRVLQVAAHAQEMFDYLYVWHPSDPHQKDPLLVGYRGKYDSSPEKTFMLARWGDVLVPLSELRSIACDKFRKTCKAALDRIKRECDTNLAQLDLLGEDGLCETKGELPHFYYSM